ncbi:MAG: hypothetical protein ACLQM6_11920 [Acidobacteriaceae bacterium]
MSSGEADQEESGLQAAGRRENNTMHNHSDEAHEPDFTPTYQEESHKQPYWKRAHLDWRVWVAAFFIFAAIAVYVWTVDLSMVPRV